MNALSFFRARAGLALAALVFLVLAVIFLQCFVRTKLHGAAVRASAVDYSRQENWLSLDRRGAQNAVDVFFLYPTCYFSGEKDFCEVDDGAMRAEAQKLRDAHSGIFDKANFFAPYYRQLGIPYMKKTLLLGLLPAAVEAVPLEDCKRAFQAYLEAAGNGRPLIFASHSQGSLVMKALLLWIKEEYPAVLERTVAAYLIGFSVNERYTRKLGLDFAQGADDTGVIISYNTETPEARFNPFIFLRPGTLAINPINWRRDETYAGFEQSLGSRVRFGEEPPVERPHFADARLNLSRGTVVTGAAISDSYWAPGVLHRYDYDLYYYDLRENVRVRILSFFAK
ncbi:MAG: DUF3089 domain-containing protein [Spirochaetaceae bacterium]|jgi:hypothetical protein|nr:DUF3089 domain-containing protein [Spirochaetaceae bacterium]